MRTIRVETFDGKLRYEVSPNDTDKIYVDGRLIKPKKPKSSLYRCTICNEEFDTRTGKGKTHMASRHSRNLKYALETGLAVEIQK